MRKNFISIIGMLIVSAFIAGSAFCEQGACSLGKDGARHAKKEAAIARELKLTAEQDKLLKEAKASHRAGMAELFKAMKAKRQELKTALAKPDATKEQVAPIAAEIKGLQAEMIDRRIDGIFEIKKILTPEQFQKLEEMKKDCKKEDRKARKEHKDHY